MTASAPAKSTSIRVHPETHAALAELAERARQPLTQYVAQLAEQKRRRVFFAALNASMERLRADPNARAEYDAESRQLDGTLLDGLEKGEDWSGVFDGAAPPW